MTPTLFFESRSTFAVTSTVENGDPVSVIVPPVANLWYART